MTNARTTIYLHNTECRCAVEENGQDSKTKADKSLEIFDSFNPEWTNMNMY